MFKKLPLTLVLALLGAASYAQTIVSTTPQNKNVVLEEFTGINCTFCPDGHAIAQAIKDANPERVSLINIHVGGFANPSGSQPDFRTAFGNAIANQSGLTGYPSGTINRHVFAGTTTALGRGQWTSRANQTLALESEVNIGVEASIDITTRELTVHVEAFYTADSPESTNKLNIALLQNNTLGPQTGGGMGNNYNHMHRLVHLLTGQWGEDITTTTEGTFVDRTFTYTIPADFRDIPAILDDMEIVAFISHTTQEIPTGQTARPTFTGLTIANDVNIREIKPIDPTCSDQLSATINIKNEGQNTLTSLPITYTINGESHTYNWVGNLPALWDADIELPEVTYTLSSSNTLEVSIPNDDDNSNNSGNLEFDEAAQGTGTIDMEIRTDNWGYEFNWQLKNSSGEIVESGSAYPSGSTTTLRINLDADCYTLILNDTASDGGTRVTIDDHEGTRLFFAAGNWGNKRTGEFSSNGVLGINDTEFGNINIYPNPTRDILNISNAENADVQVFDLLGKMILSQDNISLNEQLNVSKLNTGAYFIKISKEGSVTTKKFIVSK